MSEFTPIRILAIDPATGKSGYAILDVTFNPLHVKVVTRGTLDGEKLYRTRKQLAQNFDRSYCILDALEEYYRELMAVYQPDIIVSEGAFGYQHLAALISLTQVILILKRIAHSTIGRAVVIIPPTISKLSFAQEGHAGKPEMREAFLNCPYLDRGENPESASEHEIDAISHGIAYVNRDILHTVVQNQKKKKQKKKKTT